MNQESNMNGERDSYLETVARLEPDLTAIDMGPGLASAAISLKRIADSLATLVAPVDAVAPGAVSIVPLGQPGPTTMATDRQTLMDALRECRDAVAEHVGPAGSLPLSVLAAADWAGRLLQRYGDPLPEPWTPTATTKGPFSEKMRCVGYPDRLCVNNTVPCDDCVPF